MIKIDDRVKHKITVSDKKKSQNVPGQRSHVVFDLQRLRLKQKKCWQIIKIPQCMPSYFYSVISSVE